MNISRPKLIIIAGPNGSGKTSVTGKILQHQWIENCFYIDPDNIAQDEFGDWNSPEAVIKPAFKAAELREKYLSQKKEYYLKLFCLHLINLIISEEQKLQDILFDSFILELIIPLLTLPELHIV